MVVGAIGHFTWTSFQGIIVGCYLLIFGIGVILLEFRPPLQPAIKKYAGFMQRYMGRGILFIFLGVLGLDNRLILEISGGTVAAIGVIFVIIEFFPIEPTLSMGGNAPIGPSTDERRAPPTSEGSTNQVTTTTV